MGIGAGHNARHCLVRILALYSLFPVVPAFNTNPQTRRAMTATPQVSAAAAQRPFYAGVDVGGTNTKLGILDSAGNTVAADKIPTVGGVEDVIRSAASKLDEMCTASGVGHGELHAAGLATPGPMDIPAGMVLSPYNLPEWGDYPIRDCLSDALGVPVSYANDATAAAFGEFWVGSGADYSSVALVTLGTGVGGGFIVDGEAIHGAHSHASEVGHITIDTREDARMCPCGQPGHLEAYCSATALVKRARGQLDAGVDSSLTDRLADGSPLTARMIAEEGEKEDQLSLVLIFELAAYLGFGLVIIGHTIDPDAIILGGAMNFGGSANPLGQQFVDRVGVAFRKHAMPIPAEKTKIAFARLGGDAGYVGAAGIAKHAHAG